MDKKTKFNLMQKVSRELADLKNSQEAVIKKVTQIEADNFELNDNSLEEVLAEVHDTIANNLQKVDEISTQFQQKTAQYETENSAALAAEV